MKKLTALILAALMALSLTACGKDKAEEPAPAPAPEVAAPEATPAPPAEAEPASAPEAEFTPEQQAAAQKFIDMSARYDEVADKVNADPNLAELQDVVTLMNEIGTSVVEADAVFASPDTLDDQTLANIDIAIEQTILFLDEVEAMLANYGGKEVIVIQTEIINDTGVDIAGLAMSPQSDESWGANLLDTPLAAGEIGVTEMTITADSLVWDLLAADSEGNTLSFMGIDFTEAPTEGAQLLLTVEGDQYVATIATQE